jgi:hypothetical protein
VGGLAALAIAVTATALVIWACGTKHPESNDPGSLSDAQAVGTAGNSVEYDTLSLATGGILWTAPSARFSEMDTLATIDQQRDRLEGQRERND